MSRRSEMRGLAIAAAAAIIASTAAAQKAPDSEGRTYRACGGRTASAHGSSLSAGAICRSRGRQGRPRGSHGGPEERIGGRHRPHAVHARWSPAPSGNAFPFQIVQTRGQVTIVYEMNHAIRLVDMTKPLANDETLSILPYYDGHSAGIGKATRWSFKPRVSTKRPSSTRPARRTATRCT